MNVQRLESEDVLPIISPRAPDNSMYSKSTIIVFNTQNFEHQEVQQLCDILNKRFGYKTWVKKNKGKYVVAISGKSYEDFMKNVSPHIIPSMQHKLPKPRKS